MSKPRTPVHFPAMRVRGARNRRKLAARYRRIFVIPYARPRQNADGSTTFDVVSVPEPGAMQLQFTTVTDGFGRRVPDGRDR